jgi:UDP-N-acetylmuramate dehydrogenase
MTIMDIHLPSPYAARLLRDEPLARYTAARLGGPADLLYVARESLDELAAVVGAAWTQGVPLRVLGGGANVLVRDGGLRGLVVINHVSEVTYHDDAALDVTSGHALTVLARKCAARGLAGFEWAASVPGTIGGAVVNNAGAHGGDMAGNVVTVELLDAARGRCTMTNAELGYGYRTSVLKGRETSPLNPLSVYREGTSRTDEACLVPTNAHDAATDSPLPVPPLVLSARLALTRDDPDAITSRMDGFIAHRKKTQPPGASLGSIYKNPPGDYAGRLIEACGLKGLRIGGAEVSPLHGNFFINSGSASPDDYAALILHVQAEVARRTGVTLEAEVEIIGEERS